MRNRFSLFQSANPRWRLTFSLLVLCLGSTFVFAQAPSSTDGTGGLTPPNPQSEVEEPQARAWLAVRQKQRGQFKKMAEGEYSVKSSTALNKFGEPSEISDVWTLWKLENGGFLVDGEFKSPKSRIKASSTSYQVNLDNQMRPAAYKIFGGKLVSGCMWTTAKLYCQETYGRGDVEGSAGASIDDSTRLLAPLFPFLYNGLTPSSKVQLNEITCLTLLTLAYSDEPGALIDLIPEYASVSLVRQAIYSIPEPDTKGSEFQLGVQEILHAAATHAQDPVIPPDSEHKVPYKPFCKFVVASNGILLSATDAKTQREFIRLMQFKKFADF
jgi:hypothetical protein